MVAWVWPINDLYKVKTNTDHKVTKGGVELMYKQYMTLQLSAAATFNAKKTLKDKQALREDSYVDIYYMEGYLHEDDYEYHFNSGSYDDFGHFGNF